MHSTILGVGHKVADPVRDNSSDQLYEEAAATYGAAFGPARPGL